MEQKQNLVEGRRSIFAKPEITGEAPQGLLTSLIDFVSTHHSRYIEIVKQVFLA